MIVEAPTVGPAITERYEQATKAFVPLFRAGRELNPRGAELPDDDRGHPRRLGLLVRLPAPDRRRGGASCPTYLPELIELVLRTYLGQAEASRIARAEAPARQHRPEP